MENVKFTIRVLTTIGHARTLAESSVQEFLEPIYDEDDTLFDSPKDEINEALENNGFDMEGEEDVLEDFDNLDNDEFAGYTEFDEDDMTIYYKPCTSEDIDAEQEELDINAVGLSDDAQVVVELPLVFDWDSFYNDYV